MSKTIDLSLDRIRRLLTFLPPYTRPTIHIAGTNGKGSVSCLISSILHSSGISYGRFNSPHLVDRHDSISVNGKTVDLGLFKEVERELREADERNGVGVSEFEVLTCVALGVFERVGVQVVVLEVGMGGRLDATNIIEDSCVLVDALTSVDLDHQAILGNTVEEIAREKAGIARKGRPFVLGRQKYGEVVNVAREAVSRLGGEIIDVSPVRKREWDYEVDGERSEISFIPSKFTKPSPTAIELDLPCFKEPVKVLLPLHGDHQLDNLAIATTVISTLLANSSCTARTSSWSTRITAQTVATGIKATSWPGRLSFHSISVPLRSSNRSDEARRLIVLADGAHNSASSSTLASYISHLLATASTPSAIGTNPKPRTIHLTYILGLSHSPPKTPLQTLSPLLSTASGAISDSVRILTSVACLRFTPPEGMPWVQSVPPLEIKRTVKELLPDAEVWTPESEGIRDEDEGGKAAEGMRKALMWAAERIYGPRMSETRDEPGEASEEREGLVVVAGSLYLVADLYRLLDG